MPVVTRIRINGQVPWRCHLSRSGNWIAVCDPLKLTLQSDTWLELMEDMALAIDALMKEMVATHDLDRFLRDRGWTLIGPIPTETENVCFDIPFLPSMTGSHDPQNCFSQ